MPSLWAVAGASTVSALGITLLVAAIAGDPVRCAVSRRLAGPAIAFGALAAAAAGLFATRHLALAALTAAGVALAAAAAAIALLRARPSDEDGGGGAEGGGDEPAPDPPGGAGGIDWEQFEAAFRDYVARQPVRS